METLYIEPTGITPLVHFDSQIGLLDLKGRSSPENSVVFYGRIVDYLDRYMEIGNDLTVNVAFDYFNTSSLKNIFVLLQKVGDFRKKGANVAINWYYEEDDEDMLESGEDLDDVLELGFNFIKTQFVMAS